MGMLTTCTIRTVMRRNLQSPWRSFRFRFFRPLLHDRTMRCRTLSVALVNEERAEYLQRRDDPASRDMKPSAMYGILSKT